MNPLDHMIGAVNEVYDPKPDRLSQVDWMILNKDEWIDYVNGHDKNELARLARNPAAWDRFWTGQREKIEAAYEEATKQPPEPPEPDTVRQKEARDINADMRRAHG
jgi:hypothetical protein